MRLGSQLTGWRIDILTEEQDIERRAKEQESQTQLFVGALDVDDMIAHLLVAEGFTSVKEVADVDTGEFSTIEGFDEEISQELQNRARNYLENEEVNMTEEARTLGAADDLLGFEQLRPKDLLALVKKGVKTRDDFADLSGDELRDILGASELTLDDANALIMKAREHWFANEQ